MANTQAPYGLRLVKNEGKEYQVNRYIKKTGAAIYPGDAVKQDAAGNVLSAAAGDALLGVALEYKASADITPIAIVHDPDAVYEIQCDDAFALADIFNNANITATTGDTSLLTSKQDLDIASMASNSNLQLKILGLSPVVGNVVGSFAKVLVKINNHTLRGGTGTVGV